MTYWQYFSTKRGLRLTPGIAPLADPLFACGEKRVKKLCHSERSEELSFECSEKSII